MKLRNRILRTAFFGCTVISFIGCESGTGPRDELPKLRIATTSFKQSSVSIFSENGARLYQLSCGTGCFVYAPRWAPDSGVLAIIGIKDLYSILYVADTSGNMTEVARSASRVEGGIQGTTHLVYPKFSQVWSASGQLAYVQGDTILGVTSRYGQNPRALVVKPAGISGIQWVGDTAVAFVSQNALFVATLSSGALKLVDDFQASVGAPIWAPDGSAFVTAAKDGNRTTLYRYNVRTHATVAQGTFDTIGSLCWSSDSKGVAFVARDLPDIARTYVLTLDGGTPVQITTQSSTYVLGWHKESKILATLEAAGVAVYDTDSWKLRKTVSLEPNVSFVDVAGATCSQQFYSLPDS